jgi:hypothetical protein
MAHKVCGWLWPLLALAAACGSVPTRFAVMPEQRFRLGGVGEGCIEPTALPLSADARTCVEDFLAVDGDNDGIGVMRSSPGAPTHYAPLLRVLQSHAPSFAELQREPFTRYFEPVPIRALIDARRDAPFAPAATQPFVLREANYDWVFYPDPAHPQTAQSFVIVRRPAFAVER